MAIAERKLQQQFYSEAFKLEYAKQTPRQAIYNDIVSYLAEYRLEVQVYEFEQYYEAGRLRDSIQGLPMTDVGKRCIQEKIQRGENTARSESDLTGMQRIEEQMPNAHNGDVFIYASPPDQDEGYTYGFIYTGKVIEDVQGKKKLGYKAIRLDHNQSLDNYNRALSQTTGLNVNLDLSRQFPATPFLIKRQDLADQDPDLTVNLILNRIFGSNFDPVRQRMHSQIIDRLSDPINDLIDRIQQGNIPSLLKPYFFALENQALELKKEYEKYKSLPDYKPVSADDRLRQWNYQPPPVIGSCGSSTKSGGSDTFGYGSIFGSIFKNFSVNSSKKDYFDHDGTCKYCNNGPKRLGPCDICESCDEILEEKAT